MMNPHRLIRLDYRLEDLEILYELSDLARAAKTIAGLIYTPLVFDTSKLLIMKNSSALSYSKDYSSV